MSFSNPKTTAKTSTIAIAKRQSRSLPLGILMALFVCSAAHAVNVQFKLSNFGFDPNAIQAVRLLPTNSTPTVQSNRIIINASITKFTDTNGNVTFTNVFGGSYLVFVSATNVGGGVASPTIFRITGLPTNSTSTVDASDYISVAVPSDIARYLAAGTNIVFVTNSGTLTIHGTVAGSSGGGSIAVYSNNAAVAATNVVRLESTNSGNVSFNWTSNATGVARFSASVNGDVTNGLHTNVMARAVTNNPTSGGTLTHAGQSSFAGIVNVDTLKVTNGIDILNGELNAGSVAAAIGEFSVNIIATYLSSNRVAIIDSNWQLTNTATVTPTMLEGFSPADIGLTNLVATKIDTNNGTGFNLTVRSNSASAGAALIANGNVGINNPTPSAWLDISNMVGATIRALFHAGTNAQNGLTVSTNGSVGIGTNNPTSPLVVAGSVLAANGGSLQVGTDGNVAVARSGNNMLLFAGGSGSQTWLYAVGSQRWQVSATALFPSSDAVYDIGTADASARRSYTRGINLGKTNANYTSGAFTNVSADSMLYMPNNSARTNFLNSANATNGTLITVKDWGRTASGTNIYITATGGAVEGSTYPTTGYTISTDSGAVTFQFDGTNWFGVSKF